jgi:hypothetical protein
MGAHVQTSELSSQYRWQVLVWRPTESVAFYSLNMFCNSVLCWDFLVTLHFPTRSLSVIISTTIFPMPCLFSSIINKIPCNVSCITPRAVPMVIKPVTLLQSRLHPMVLRLTPPLLTGIIPGGKGGRYVGLTTLPLSCADCLEIWEPQTPGTLTACPGV